MNRKAYFLSDPSDEKFQRDVFVMVGFEADIE